MVISLLIFLGIFIGLQFLFLYLLYEMPISRIINTRLAKLKCMIAEKELELSICKEKYFNCSEEFKKSISDRNISLADRDKLSAKCDKLVKKTSVLDKDLIKLNSSLAELNKYKKD